MSPAPARIPWFVLAAIAAALLAGLWAAHAGCAGQATPMSLGGSASTSPAESVCLVTWNIRGYPEQRAEDTVWFETQLGQLGADVLCIQEIANAQRLAELRSHEPRFTHEVFADSADGQDNAILTTAAVQISPLPVPAGFQHPPEAAYVAYRGFDAVIVTVHLSWADVSRRDEETRLLASYVSQSLTVDPDVLVVGDFNLPPPKAHALATRLGLVVLDAAAYAGGGTLYSGSSYDYFMASPDLATEEAAGAAVVEFAGADLETARRVSDHKPVLARFRCADGFRDRPAEPN